MASGSFAEVATFFREERAHFEAKMEAQRKELEAKLEAQRQETEAQRKGFEIQRKELEERLEAKLDAQRKEFEIKLETQRQEIEQKDAMTSVSDAQLERLQERLDALHQAKLLTDDEMTALEDKVADFIDCRASVAPRDIGAASGIVRKLVGMCEGVSKDGMLARQLRNRYL
jgi:DNA repair exonuclease SbcCD ATPase subunit